LIFALKAGRPEKYREISKSLRNTSTNFATPRFCASLLKVVKDYVFRFPFLALQLDSWFIKEWISW